MLDNFPLSYPDELFYSLCARYSRRMGYPDAKTLTQNVLGSRNALAVVDLPAHLENFYTALPKGYFDSVHHIIDNHTLLPFYKPFMATEQAKKIENAMLGGADTHLGSGLMASLVSVPAWLRYCPVCVEEDRVDFGEPYWRRLHQLPGCSVCPVHNMFLENSDIKVSNRRNRHKFVAAQDAFTTSDPLTINLELHSHRVYLELAKDASWLLNQTPSAGGLKPLQKKYLWILAQKGYATYSGRVRIAELTEAVKEFYGETLLELLQCPLSSRTQETWLHRIVRRPKGSHHPLRHLLLMRFLGHSPESFFAPFKQEPFGVGPWPCLNRAANHYMDNLVHQITLHYTKDGGRPVGTFKCQECGFTYQRAGPDQNNDDRYRVDRMADYGPVWHEQSRKFSASGLALREKARRLGVTTRTVERYETALTTNKNTESSDTAGPQHEATREVMRATWRKLWQKQSKAGVTELRKQAPHTYMWLYRNDRYWLRNFTAEHATLNRVILNQRVDWDARDQALASSVAEAFENLKASESKPTKITVASLARELGQLAIIQKHPLKLPRTLAAIHARVETREDYAIRRIIWATQHFKHEKKHLKSWQLERLAGLRPDLLTSDKVIQALAEASVKLKNLSVEF